MDALQNTGLQEDCPFSVDEAAEPLTPESAGKVPDADFAEYAGRLNAYLQVKLSPCCICMPAFPEVSSAPPEECKWRCLGSMRLLSCLSRGGKPSKGSPSGKLLALEGGWMAHGITAPALACAIYLNAHLQK